MAIVYLFMIVFYNSCRGETMDSTLADVLRNYYGLAEQGAGKLRGLLNYNNLRQGAEYASMTPTPLGDVASGLLAVDALRQGNYGDAALNAVGLLPFVPGMAGVIGKHHQDVLGRMNRVPDEIVDQSFGHAGNIYATPMRPFENAQANMLGVSASPIAERVFKTEKPLTAKQLSDIEGVPISSDAAGRFAQELSDEGAMAMMDKKGRMAVVMPSTKGSGFQMTEFDSKGAIGDSQFKSSAEALMRMIENGYSKIVDENMASRMLNKFMGLK